MSRFTFFDSSDSEEEEISPQVDRDIANINHNPKPNRTANRPVLFCDSDSDEDGEDQTGGAAVTRNQAKRLRLNDSDQRDQLPSSLPLKDQPEDFDKEESEVSQDAVDDLPQENDIEPEDAALHDDRPGSSQSNQGPTEDGDGAADQDHLETSTLEYDKDTLVVQNELVEAHIYRTYFRRQKNFS